MAKVTTVSSSAEAVAEPESKSKTKPSVYTRWDTFDKANYGVSRIVCECLPGRPADEACKTALIPTAASVIAHMQAEHGGGFMFTIRETKTPWKGWKELAAAGVEIHWIQDQVNDHKVDLSVRALKGLLKPHQGKFRGAWQAFNHLLRFNLSFSAPDSSGDDYFDDPDATNDIEE